MSSSSMGGSFLPDSNQTITGLWTFSQLPTYTGLGTQVTTAATQTLTAKTLTSPVLTTPVINGLVTGTAFGDRVTRCVVTALTGAAIHAGTGGVIAVVNPESASIIITRVVLDLTTVNTSGACTLDIGTTAVSATTTSDTLIDGVDVQTGVGTFDNISNAGSNGKALQKLASGKWVTIDEKTGDVTGLVANLYLFYVLA